MSKFSPDDKINSDFCRCEILPIIEKNKVRYKLQIDHEMPQWWNEKIEKKIMKKWKTNGKMYLAILRILLII